MIISKLLLYSHVFQSLRLPAVVFVIMFSFTFLSFTAIATVGVCVVFIQLPIVSPLNNGYTVGLCFQFLAVVIMDGGRDLLGQKLCAGQELGRNFVQMVDELRTSLLPRGPVLKPVKVLQDFFGTGLKARMERIQISLNGGFHRAIPIL